MDVKSLLVFIENMADQEEYAKYLQFISLYFNLMNFATSMLQTNMNISKAAEKKYSKKSSSSKNSLQG